MMNIISPRFNDDVKRHNYLLGSKILTTKPLAFVLIIYCLVIGPLTSWAETTNDNPFTRYELNENSVVLITGAAGFIGSELAMSLARIYHVKKLICIDRMDRGFGIATKAASSTKRHDENELALFEFKRQRLFRLLQQTSVSDIPTKVFFYRVDFRPSIPEYYDSTEVPVLHYIFSKDHPDITHVVHLADHYHRTGMENLNSNTSIPTNQQIIPRIKGGEKAGMMESLLEEIRLYRYNNPEKPIPHLLYASSADVYDYYNTHHATGQERMDRANAPPFREHLPITIPSTIAGTSKLIDEMLAQTYHDITPNGGLKSIGLRFFTIYGPWGLPGSPLFEMAETAVQNVAAAGQQQQSRTMLTKNSIPVELLDDIKDYCYIDDAIDAIMAAMQFEPPDTNPAVVFNVGSGEGQTLRSIAHMMNDIIMQGDIKNGTAASTSYHQNEDYNHRAPPTTSIANLDRIHTVLGYEPQVTLQQGLELTLGWHYDRSFPYGTGSPVVDNPNHISQKGMVSCESSYDLECLKGNPVFPCSSECANTNQCISTLYDDVMELTRYITTECTTVMYTVSLDISLRDIPSIHYQVSSTSIPYVVDGNGFCNVAFVADRSPLFLDQASKTARRVMMNDGQSSTSSSKNNNIGQGSIIKHGFWTLIPVAVTDYVASSRSRNNRNETILSIAHHREILEMIPKLSPTLFFGKKVQHAIYCDIDIVFDSIPRLLQEANMQPQPKTTNAKENHGNKGATVMMIGKKQSNRKYYEHRNTKINPSRQSLQQEIAYRTIRMAVIDEMMGDGFAQTVDSSFIVHNLFQQSELHFADNNNDSKFFRCDILGEVIQWNVPTDNAAIEFIMSLHDMWSRIMVEKDHIKPWWVGNDVITIPSSDKSKNDFEKLFGHIQKQQPQQVHRRLQEINDDQLTEMDNDSQGSRRLQENQVEEDEFVAQNEANIAAEDGDVDDDSVTSASDKEQTDHNGFGVAQEAFQAVFGGGGIRITSSDKQSAATTTDHKHKKVERFAQPDDEQSSNIRDSTDIDDFVVTDENDDDEGTAGGNEIPLQQQESLHRLSSSRLVNYNNLQQEDLSSYDVWMGILSSTNIRYFSRIVSMEAVGAYRLGDYEK